MIKHSKYLLKIYPTVRPNVNVRLFPFLKWNRKQNLCGYFKFIKSSTNPEKGAFGKHVLEQKEHFEENNVSKMNVLTSILVTI